MMSAFGLEYKLLNLDNIDVAFTIQRETWPEDHDYVDLYDKDDLIGITGIDVFRQYLKDIWLDWFAVLPKYRREGYGEKILLDTINCCKLLNRYKCFEIEVTYRENRPSIFLYDKVIKIKENYKAGDTNNYKTQILIYVHTLRGGLEL